MAPNVELNRLLHLMAFASRLPKLNFVRENVFTQNRSTI